MDGVKVYVGTYCGRAAVSVAVSEELVEDHAKAPDVRSHRELALGQRLGRVPAAHGNGGEQKIRV